MVPIHKRPAKSNPAHYREGGKQTLQRPPKTTSPAAHGEEEEEEEEEFIRIQRILRSETLLAYYL